MTDAAASLASPENVTRLIPGGATNLAQLSDEELLANTRRLVGKSNQLLAALLLHLAEVEVRGVHRAQRCASLYTYCIYELRFSEDAAARRSAAARFVRQFPALLAAVANGELHLTGLLMIGPHLTPENEAEVLGRARFRTKKELAKLIRELNPLPGVPDFVEPLGPAPMKSLRKPTWAEFVESFCPAVRDLPPGERPRDWVNAVKQGDTSDGAEDACLGEPRNWANDAADEACLSEQELPVGPVPANLPPVTGPLHYLMQFATVEEHVQLVERAKALMARQRPGVSLGELHHEAMKLLVASLEKQKFAAGVASRQQRPNSSESPQRGGAPSSRLQRSQSFEPPQRGGAAGSESQRPNSSEPRQRGGAASSGSQPSNGSEPRKRGCAASSEPQRTHDSEPRQRAHDSEPRQRGGAASSEPQRAHGSEPRKRGCAASSEPQRAHDSEPRQRGDAPSSEPQRTHDSEPRQRGDAATSGSQQPSDSEPRQRAHDSEPRQRGDAPSSGSQPSNGSEPRQRGDAPSSEPQRTHDSEPRQRAHGSEPRQRAHGSEPRQRGDAPTSGSQQPSDPEPRQRGDASSSKPQRTHDSEPRQRAHGSEPRQRGGAASPWLQRSQSSESRQPGRAASSGSQQPSDPEPHQRGGVASPWQSDGGSIGTPVSFDDAETAAGSDRAGTIDISDQAGSRRISVAADIRDRAEPAIAPAAVAVFAPSSAGADLAELSKTSSATSGSADVLRSAAGDTASRRLGGRSRHVPAAVRREVYERDAGRCSYFDVRGERCCETRYLELHHLVPFAKGGALRASNLALRCSAHNRLAAERDFGPEVVAVRRDAARHESRAQQLIDRRAVD